MNPNRNFKIYSDKILKIHFIPILSHLIIIYLEYCPKVFSRLRKEWGCDTIQLAEDLLVPILQLQANRIHIFSESKAIIGTSIPSVSKKFTVMTTSQKDVHTFFTFVKAYAKYILANPDSLLCHVVGIFRCSFNILHRVYVLIMYNPEYSCESIPMISSRIYTLQGVKFKQPITPLRDAGPISRPVMFFDRNLDRTFSMGSQYDKLVSIIRRDVDFLKQNFMISYTLVLSVGRLVVPDEQDLDVSLIEKEKRGLVESAFGEWVLLAGIYDIWKFYGAKEFVSTSMKSIWNSEMVDPVSYADRFLEQLETRLTK